MWQVPQDGTVSIALQPGGLVIGSQVVYPDANLGSAAVTITRPADGAAYGYGAHTGELLSLFSLCMLFLPLAGASADKLLV